MSTGSKPDTGMPNTYQPNTSDDRKVAKTGWGSVYESLARAIEQCEDIEQTVEYKTTDGLTINAQVLRATRRAESALRTAAFVLAAAARS